MTDRWGPWIDHDGRGVPKDLRIGMLCEVKSECSATGSLVSAVAVLTGEHLRPYNWVWGASTHDTLCYRIQNPKGVDVLQSLVADPQGPADDAPYLDPVRTPAPATSQKVHP